MFKTLRSYLKKSPINYTDRLLWCSIMLTAPVLYYYTVYVIIKLIVVFICLFVFLEGIDIRQSVSLKWSFKFQPLRLLVAIPIYYGLFGIIPFLKELVFIPYSLMVCPSDGVIVIVNLIVMSPVVYTVTRASYLFIVLKTIPSRMQLIICASALYWATLGKLILIVIRKKSMINSCRMFVTGNDGDKEGGRSPRTHRVAWQFHEDIRKELETRINKSHAGEHTQEASGPHTIDSMNLQALGDRVVHDCGRIVCKAVQSIANKQEQKGEKSPKSPSQSPFNPF